MRQNYNVCNVAIRFQVRYEHLPIIVVQEQQYLSQCPSCVATIDVSAFEPFTKITCPSCQESVRVRRKFDHFLIIKQIGEGGMSRVFEAEDETLGRRVALKILNRTYSRDANRMQQFQTEALITARVTHPNVIRLFSVGYDQGYFYIAMELVTGGSLEQRIKRDGTVKEKDALRIGRQVADGLRAAYRMGLQHRDVKPANILFTEDGTAKVVDFGLALFVTHQDQSGEIWATPFYVSPEKVIDNREDFRGDLFSLGATLYHALTGKPPHKANTNSLHELRMIKCRRVALEDTGMPFSPRTIHIVDKLLAFKPEDRPETYDEAVDELRLAEGLSDRSFMPGASRRRKLGVIAASAIVAAFAVGMIARNISTKPTAMIVDASQEGAGTTLSAGQKNTGESFLSGRDALFKGDFAEAEKAFKKFIKDGAHVQPTLNHARYDAAVAAIINGSRKFAENFFADMANEPASNDPYMAFCKKLGGVMEKNLGVDRKSASLPFGNAPEDVMAYLVHGLAQWHYGDPVEGADSLQRFFQGNADEKAVPSLAKYRAALAPYKADITHIATLTKPERNISPEGAKALLAETKDIRSKLQTKGRFATELDRRIERLLKAPMPLTEEQRQKLKDQLVHKKRELDQFTEFSKTLPALARGYDFSPVMRILKDMQFDSPEVQSAMDGKIYLYQGASDFLTQLFKDIGAQAWQGTVERRDNAPIAGWVTACTLQDLTISLSRNGVNAAKIPLDQVDPEVFVKIAQSYCATIRDTTDYQRRQELIAIFARVEGLTDVASSVASQLMDECRPFRARWMKVL